MTLNLELEIKILLLEFDDPDVVAHKLIELFAQRPEDWSEKSARQFCVFMLNCGLYKTLIQFCLENLANEKFAVPWPHFVQALTLGLPKLDEEIAKFVAMGIEEQQAGDEVSLALGADRYVANASEIKTSKRLQRLRSSKQLKIELMQQLVTLRTQQLFEQEKILLSRLQRMFPGDPDIADVLRDHKERNALEVLSRRSPLSRGTTLRDPAPSQETQLQINSMKTSLLEAARQNPELVFDFAMAADMLEAPELALTILQQVPLTHDQQWFLLEVKLKCRRFLEVLSDLNQLELALAHEPETFFATAYLRAQAYWGMQQKHMAIEILENILEARPNYRSSSALLDLWRMQ